MLKREKIFLAERKRSPERSAIANLFSNCDRDRDRDPKFDEDRDRDRNFRDRTNALQTRQATLAEFLRKIARDIRKNVKIVPLQVVFNNNFPLDEREYFLLPKKLHFHQIILTKGW